MFITNEMRQREGQYSYVADAVMITCGVERMGTCGACGHRIELHVGVQSPKGGKMWVGFDCARILTAGDTPASVVTPEGVREYIVPGAEWVANLRKVAYANFERRIYRNEFLAGLYWQWESRGRLTVKQYNAANKAMAA